MAGTTIATVSKQQLFTVGAAPPGMIESIVGIVMLVMMMSMMAPMMEEM